MHGFILLKCLFTDEIMHAFIVYGWAYNWPIHNYWLHWPSERIVFCCIQLENNALAIVHIHMHWTWSTPHHISYKSRCTLNFHSAFLIIIVFVFSISFFFILVSISHYHKSLISIRVLFHRLPISASIISERLIQFNSLFMVCFMRNTIFLVRMDSNIKIERKTVFKKGQLKI